MEHIYYFLTIHSTEGQGWSGEGGKGCTRPEWWVGGERDPDLAGEGEGVHTHYFVTCTICISFVQASYM